MNNRTVVITGASSLIGQAIAKRLISKGDHVLLHCFKNSTACYRFSESADYTSEIVVADFSRREELDAFCGKLGDLDVLVNAAACTRTDLLPNLDNDDVGKMIDVNVIALIAVCRAALPGMIVRRKGIIVNISSVAAQRGNRGQSVYAGTKGFMESFTRSLAAEYGSRGIRVNSVAPGAIEAGSLKELLSYAGETVKKSTASTRLGMPEDVAAAVAFLCGPDGAFINGACIAVNGGFMTGV